MSKCSSAAFAAVLNMPCYHVDNNCLDNNCLDNNYWAQRSCFHCQDREEIGIIVALESGVQLAIKREGESCIAFIRIKFISNRDVEHLSLR